MYAILVVISSVIKHEFASHSRGNLPGMVSKIGANTAKPCKQNDPDRPIDKSHRK